jgi:hypothetical protein
MAKRKTTSKRTPRRKTVFVIQPFDKAFEAVYELIASAASQANANAIRADSAILPGDDFATTLLNVIQSADLLIADVSRANPNVMYEVGLAQARQKPLLLIADSSRNVPFDLAGMRVLIYDISNPGEFVSRLSELMAAALRSPTDFSLPKSKERRDKKNSLFVSYSHADREYLDRLMVHLRPLEKEGLIDLWVDTRLRAGDRWKKEIEKALERANVAVLLVSADFLASDFITDNELPPLLRKAEDQGTRIIPLIVKPCRFTRDKHLRHFQPLNDPRKSLILVEVGEQEAYYDQLASEVEQALQRG